MCKFLLYFSIYRIILCDNWYGQLPIFRMIEENSKRTGRNPFETLLDEWGTVGRNIDSVSTRNFYTYDAHYIAK